MEILDIMDLVDMLFGTDLIGTMNRTISTIAWLIVILAAIPCFFGYRLYRIFIAVSGFITGALIGGLLGLLTSGGEPGLAIIVGLLFGVLGAFLAYRLYKLGVFLTCFSTGALLGFCIGLLTKQVGFGIVLALICGILLGVLGVKLTKPVIVISTGFGGGICMGIAFSLIVKANTAVGVIFGILISLAGCYFQFRKKTVESVEADATVQSTSSDHQGLLFNIKEGAKTSLSKISETGAVQNLLAKAKDGTKTGISKVSDVGEASDLVGKARHTAQSAINRIANKDFSSNTALSTVDIVKRQQNPQHTILSSNQTALWSTGVPILITEAQFVKRNDNASNDVYFNLAFQNLSKKEIIGIFCDIQFSDLLKEDTCRIEKFAIQDVHVASGELFILDEPVLLSNENSRRCSIKVKNVVFADGEIWTNDNHSELSPIAEQRALPLSPELLQEFYRKSNEVFSGVRTENILTQQPVDFEEYWLCSCGQLNTLKTCLTCGVDKETIFELANEKMLQESYQKRLEYEQQIREERQQKIEEQKEAVKQFASDVATQTGAAINKGGEIAKNTSVVLLEKGKSFATKARPIAISTWEKLKEMFSNVKQKTTVFWNERILKNKQKILKITVIVVAGIVVAIAVVVGGKYILDKTAENLAAKQLEQQLLQAEEERRQAEEKAREEEQKRLEEEQKRLEAEAAEKAAAEALAAWEAEFYFPYSDKILLIDSDISVLSTYDLLLAKNEILARHGVIFNEDQYVDYFTPKSWYNGRINVSEFDASTLNEFESANTALIDALLEKRFDAQVAQSYLDIIKSLNWTTTERTEYSTPDSTNTSFPGKSGDRTLLYTQLIDIDSNGTNELFAVWFEWAPEGEYGTFWGTAFGYIRWSLWGYDENHAIKLCGDQHNLDSGDWLREFSISISKNNGIGYIHEEYSHRAAIGAIPQDNYFTIAGLSIETSSAYIGMHIDDQRTWTFYDSTTGSTEELSEDEYNTRISKFNSMTWNLVCSGDGYFDLTTVSEAPPKALEGVLNKLNAAIEYSDPNPKQLTEYEVSSDDAQAFIEKLTRISDTMYALPVAGLEKHISAQTAAKMLGENKKVLVDCRILEMEDVPVLYMAYLADAQENSFLKINCELWYAKNGKLEKLHSWEIHSAAVVAGISNELYISPDESCLLVFESLEDGDSFTYYTLSGKEEYSFVYDYENEYAIATRNGNAIENPDKLWCESLSHTQEWNALFDSVYPMSAFLPEFIIPVWNNTTVGDLIAMFEQYS